MFTPKYLEQLRKWRGPKESKPSFNALINQLRGRFRRCSPSEEIVLICLSELLPENLVENIKIESITNGLLKLSVPDSSTAHRTSRLLKGPHLEILKGLPGVLIHKVKVFVR